MESVMESKTDVTDETWSEKQKHFIGDSERFLTFVLDGEEYGIEIIKVREIIGMISITQVPQSQPHLKGIINLRGKIIPVFDLRSMFGMTGKDPDNETSIIIVDVDSNLAGVIVDTVSEVMDVKGEDVETGSELDQKIKTQFILGISKMNEKITILVDIDRVLEKDSLNF